EDRSRAAIEGAASIAAHIAGTQNETVGRYCSTASSHASGVKASMITVVPPAYSRGRVKMPSAPMWNSGDVDRFTSRGYRPSPAALKLLIAFHSMLSWVSIAPLGFPVVPEVYISIAISPPSTSA